MKAKCNTLTVTAILLVNLISNYVYTQTPTVDPYRSFLYEADDWSLNGPSALLYSRGGSGDYPNISAKEMYTIHLTNVTKLW